jgi:tetratricopeptide (TPR) repeat protein
MKTPISSEQTLLKARRSIARLFFHYPEDEPFLDPAQRAAKDTNLLALVAAILIVAGAIFSALAAWSAWSGALLLSFAFFGVSLLFGFLFGIPKSVSASATSESTKVTAEVPLAINTNLEQISDWLTKIIVGIGLVQLKQLPAYVNQLVTYVSPLLVNTTDSKSLCVNIFMYFTSVGFLSGWVGTRIFLSPLIGTADQKIRGGLPEAAKRDLASEMGAPIVNVEKRLPPETSGTADAAAKTVLKAALLDELTDVNDIVAWAQAQLALGNLGEATKAYQKASQLNPKDIRARLGLGVCYYASGRPIEAAISELLAALALIGPSSDAPTKIAIYENLAAAYLYTDPPGGYQTALEYVNRALALNPPNPANLYLYAAAVYGQQYTSRKRRGEPEEKLEESKRKMLELAHKAIKADPSIKERLWDLAADPSSVDNDLSPFRDDPDFLALLGRSPSSTTGDE